MTEAEALEAQGWFAAARWLEYAAAEFAANPAMAEYLRHVGQCVREEADRRFGLLAATREV